MTEPDLDRITHPSFVSKIAVRLLFIALTTIIVGGIVRVAFWRANARARELSNEPVPVQPPATYDARRARAELAAIDSLIVAAKEAVERQGEQAKSRTISREDDRQEFNRLNEGLLELQRKRATLAAEIDARAK